MTTAKVEQDGTNFSHLLQVKPFPNLEMAAKCVQPSPTTLFLDELPKIEIEEVFEHPVILAPGEHYPQTGERLLDAFLSAPKPAVLQQEVNQFVAAITAVNAASFASRRTSRQRRRESLQAIWSPLVKEEHMVYENILDDKIFIEREKAGYKMHPESCQPSGNPERVLHIILDCPTISSSSFNHLKSPPLDSGNKSTNSLLGKGFTSNNCFVFDAFPRRVFVPERPELQKLTPREAWPAFKDVHDKLHMAYRERGGQVTLIMGGNALKAYHDVCRKERVDIEKLETTESYDVWVERPRTTKIICISRIVVHVFHPSYILRFNKTSSVTVKMDNGCNFAAALAGMANVLAYDHYTKTYCRLYRESSTPEKPKRKPKTTSNATMVVTEITPVKTTRERKGKTTIAVNEIIVDS